MPQETDFNGRFESDLVYLVAKTAPADEDPNNARMIWAYEYGNRQIPPGLRQRYFELHGSFISLPGPEILHAGLDTLYLETGRTHLTCPAELITSLDYDKPSQSLAVFWLNPDKHIGNLAVLERSTFNTSFTEVALLNSMQGLSRQIQGN